MKQFAKIPQLLQAHNQIITEQEARGFIERVEHPVITQEYTQDNTADDNTLVNILGLRWNPTTDELTVAAKPSILTNNHLVTKREVLQDLSKIFDQLGFVAPVVIRAKLLMQKLWECKIAWDEPLHEDH